MIGPAFGDVGTIKSLCRIVTNNSEATPNGGIFLPDGSNRIAPLAPPLPPVPGMKGA